MGISGLSTHLKKQAPGYKLKVPTRWFRGKKIAVDTYLLSYAYMSTAIGAEAKKVIASKTLEIDDKSLTRRWLQRFLGTIATLKDAEFEPVFIFDGKAPVEKTRTRERRNTAKQNVRDEINILKEKLKNEEESLDMATRRRIVDIMSRDVRIYQHHWQELTNLLTELGFPVVTAKGEGEALCATLVKQGKCAAVFTQDSDAGAYLTPIVITEIESPVYTVSGTKYQQCTVIYYYRLFKMLKLKPEQFVDLCAMLENDYVDNVFRFGPAKCHSLIQKYGSLKAIPTSEYPDTVPEERRRAVELFQTEGEIDKGDIHAVPFSPTITNQLAAKGLLQSASRLLQLMGIVSKPSVAVFDEDQLEGHNPVDLL